MHMLRAGGRPPHAVTAHAPSSGTSARPPQQGQQGDAGGVCLSVAPNEQWGLTGRVFLTLPVEGAMDGHCTLTSVPATACGWPRAYRSHEPMEHGSGYRAMCGARGGRRFGVRQVLLLR